VALAAIKGDRTITQRVDYFYVHPNQITARKAPREGAASLRQHQRGATVYWPVSGLLKRPQVSLYLDNQAPVQASFNRLPIRMAAYPWQRLHLST
jgi:hypothetical protein